MQDPSGSTKRKLLTQIEQLKASKADTANTDKKVTPSSGDSQVMYELMMKPDTSKMEERQKLAIFESRLEALEKVLGPSEQKMVSIRFFNKRINPLPSAECWSQASECVSTPRMYP